MEHNGTWNSLFFFYVFFLFDPVHSLSAAFVLKLPLADTVKFRDWVKLGTTPNMLGTLWLTGLALVFEGGHSSLRMPMQTGLSCIHLVM